jgi:NAD(P)-dependent dehydrogenase (short-subunit alcohol dehydrogenase family)
MRVLITGAASGFGLATADELRRRGERVQGIDLRPGTDIHIADLRDQRAVDEAVRAAIEELGGMDVLINNAGIGLPADAGAAPDEEALATIDVNLVGPWRVTSAALPALMESHGRVINVASALAHVNVPYSAAYCASKRGVAAYSDILRLEYGDRIHVTTIYPGYVKTPIHQRSEELGFHLSGAVPEESLASVVRTMVGACYAAHPKRDLATSAATRTGIFLARHFPGATYFFTKRQLERLGRRGHFAGMKL